MAVVDTSISVVTHDATIFPIHNRVMAFGYRLYTVILDKTATEINVFVSTNNGTSWTTSGVIDLVFEGDIGAGERPYSIGACMDSTGLIHMVYQVGSGAHGATPEDIYYRTWDIVGGFGAQSTVLAGAYGGTQDQSGIVSIAVDSTDLAHVLLACNNTVTGDYDYVYCYQSLGWNTQLIAGNLSYIDMLTADIFFNNSDEPFVLFSGANMGDDVFYSYRSGGVWINETAGAIAATGGAYGIGGFYDTSTDEVYCIYAEITDLIVTFDSRVCIAKRSNTGVWGAPEIVTTILGATGQVATVPHIVLDHSNNIDITYVLMPLLAGDFDLFRRKKTSGVWGAEVLIDSKTSPDSVLVHGSANCHANQDFIGSLFCYVVGDSVALTLDFRSYALDFEWIVPTPPGSLICEASMIDLKNYILPLGENLYFVSGNTDHELVISRSTDAGTTWSEFSTYDLLAHGECIATDYIFYVDGKIDYSSESIVIIFELSDVASNFLGVWHRTFDIASSTWSASTEVVEPLIGLPDQDGRSMFSLAVSSSGEPSVVYWMTNGVTSNNEVYYSFPGSGAYWDYELISDDIQVYTAFTLNLLLCDGIPTVLLQRESIADSSILLYQRTAGIWGAPATVAAPTNVNYYIVFPYLYYEKSTGFMYVSYAEWGVGDPWYIKCTIWNGVSWSAPTTLDSLPIANLEVPWFTIIGKQSNDNLFVVYSTIHDVSPLDQYTEMRLKRYTASTDTWEATNIIYTCDHFPFFSFPLSDCSYDSGSSDTIINGLLFAHAFNDGTYQDFDVYSYGIDVSIVTDLSVLYSSVKHRDNMAKWVKVTWSGYPTASDIIVEVRAGNTSTVDSTWLDFEEVTSGGYVSAAINSRVYIQYRVTIINSGDYLEWILFEEVDYSPEPPVPPWGSYSIYNPYNRAFWLIHTTITRTNARWRGWRDSEKINQFMLDLTYDIAKIFYEYDSETTLLDMVTTTKTEDDYLLPTEYDLTVYMEGEGTTNYTYWWGKDDNMRIIQHVEQRIDDWR
jgi:hypothetical protein